MENLIGREHLIDISSVWNWHDSLLFAADIDHAELKVCQVSMPFVCVVFSNFCTLREKYFILQSF